MPTTARPIIQGPLFTGGLNDTDLPVLRKDNEARTQINCRIRADGALEKIKGREAAFTGVFLDINKTLEQTVIGTQNNSIHSEYLNQYSRLSQEIKSPCDGYLMSAVLLIHTGSLDTNHTVWCELFLADANGKPAGPSLGISDSVFLGNIIAPPGIEVEMTFSAHPAVVKDTKYCCVGKVSGSNPWNAPLHFRSEGGNVYPDGRLWRYHIPTAQWYEVADHDLYFKFNFHDSEFDDETIFADEITGLIVPPADQPLAVLDADNNSLCVRCPYNASASLVKLAEGKYYTYQELAAALQAALVTLNANFTASYNSTTKKFTIANSAASFAICWRRPGAVSIRSTLSALLFGFNFGLSDNSSPYSIESEFAVDELKPMNKRYFATKDKLYNEDKAEVTLPSGASVRHSDKFWSGIWNNERWYGSNGRDSYILRDGNYIRKQLNEATPIPQFGAAERETTAGDPYKSIDQLGGHVHLTNTYRYVRLGIPLQDHCTAINRIMMNVEWNLPADYSIVAYHEIPGLGYREQIGVYRYKKSDKGLPWFTYSELDLMVFRVKKIKKIHGKTRWGWAPGISVMTGQVPGTALAWTTGVYKKEKHGKRIVYYQRGGDPKEMTLRSGLTIPGSPTVNTPQYILLEFVPDFETCEGSFKIYGKVESEVNSNVYLADLSYNEMSLVLLKWTGWIDAVALGPEAGWFNLRISLKNAEGFETELSPKITHKRQTGYPFVKLDMVLSDLVAGEANIFDYDWEDINIYISSRYTSEDGEDGARRDFRPYYLLTSIPFEIAKEYMPIEDLAVGVAESTFIQYAEGDVSTSRSGPAPFGFCDFWQERMWIGGNAAHDDVVFFSNSGQPEAFNLSDQFFKIGGDGSPLTALCALGDKLLVFKETHFSFFYPAGEMVAKSDLSPFGIGTLSSRSPVAVFTETGLFCFFQGSDGHFYLTDGLRLVCISRGRLDKFVAGLNFAALDKTSGIWDPQEKEIRWSVCTGAAAKPNQTLVYDLNRNAFYLETASADLWAMDRLRPGSVNKNLILGVQNKRAFYWRNDIKDLGGPISMEYETADINFGDPELFKSYVKDEISVKGTNATQQLLVEWFLDEKAVAKGSKLLDLTTAAKRFDFNTSGMQKRIRYRLTNSDSLGQLAVGHLLSEFVPIEAARR